MLRTRLHEYLGTIQAAFLKAGNEAREDAVDCTVKLVQDLMGLGLCFVATWSATEPGSHEELKVDASEIARLVALSNGKDVFTYFVVATKAGEEWVARYHALVNDLA